MRRERRYGAHLRMSWRGKSHIYALLRAAILLLISEHVLSRSWIAWHLWSIYQYMSCQKCHMHLLNNSNSPSLVCVKVHKNIDRYGQSPVCADYLRNKVCLLLMDIKHEWVFTNNDLLVWTNRCIFVLKIGHLILLPLKVPKMVSGEIVTLDLSIWQPHSRLITHYYS